MRPEDLQYVLGGIDELFFALTKAQPEAQMVLSLGTGVLDLAPELHSATIDVSDATAAEVGQLEKMYNGRPASYGDIARGWTFSRDISNQIEAQLANDATRPIALILGTAGVGKSTGARLALLALRDRTYSAGNTNQTSSF
jgi:hypothetical protein